MGISRVKTWASGDTLTAADLNAEFNNIINNGTAVAFPMTADESAAGFDLTEVDELAFATTAATVASAIGRLRRNGANITWHDGTGGQSLMMLGSNYIAGLETSNSTSDAANDIIIAAGVATDATNTSLMRLTAQIDKQLDAAWAVGAGSGGLDTGAINLTTLITYHVHLIKRPDTGVVDALFSTSVNAPVMPANYTLRRRIASIVESTNLFLYTQMDDYFYRATMALDVTAANETTIAITRTISVPTGINVIADGSIQIVASASTAAMLITDLSQTDEAPDTTNGKATIVASLATPPATGYWRCRTNTSASIRTRRNTTGAGAITRLSTRGWTDVRGKNGGL